jgi:hypothetical protein
MKKLKIILTVVLCVAIFCGCQVKHGEEKLQIAYDEIAVGENGTSFDEVERMLGEGRWSPSPDKNPEFHWQNGSMQLTVIFDDGAKAITKTKNW